MALTSSIFLLMMVVFRLAKCSKYLMPTTISGFNWNEGRQVCISNGMDIAVISDSTSMKEINIYLHSNIVLFDIWIGLMWNISMQTFQWIDNNELSWTPPWMLSMGEPNCMEKWYGACPLGYLRDQNCVRLDVITHEWKTISCYLRYAVLCQSFSSVSNFQSTTDLPTYGNVLVDTSMKTFVSTTSSHSEKISSLQPVSSEIQLLSELTTRATELIETTMKPSITINSKQTGTISSLQSLSPNSQSRSTIELTSTQCVPCNCSSSMYVQSESVDAAATIYKVKKQETGAYIRRLTCANDTRFSARVMGFTGGIVICCVFLIIVAIDITRLKDKKAYRKHNTM